MVVTMLQARVDEEMISGLVDYFNAFGDSLPSAIVESFLIRERNSDIWRIVTLWESQEALDGYPTSVDTPEGVLMFRAADAEPSLSVSEVSARVSHK